MARDVPEAEFQEWMDVYWAKDVLELFRLERRQSFQRFAELLLAQSGGIFEATRCRPVGTAGAFDSLTPPRWLWPALGRRRRCGASP